MGCRNSKDGVDRTVDYMFKRSFRKYVVIQEYRRRRHDNFVFITFLILMLFCEGAHSNMKSVVQKMS